MQIGGCVIHEGRDSRNPWLSRFVFVEKTPCSKLAANDSKMILGILESKILYLYPHHRKIPCRPQAYRERSIISVEKISDTFSSRWKFRWKLRMRGWIPRKYTCLLSKSGIVGCTENMEKRAFKTEQTLREEKVAWHCEACGARESTTRTLREGKTNTYQGSTMNGRR